jgi:hypothetical protein
MQCLRSLDLIPIAQHRCRRTLHRRVHIGPVARRPRSLFAKNVRMAAHQLAVQMVQHIRHGEMAFVGRHLGIKQHLQQQIAQLLGQMRKIAPLNGVEDLVGLLQRVFADGIEGLFAVPRAAVGSAQPRHDLYRLLKQSRRPRGVGCDIRSESGFRGFWTKYVLGSVHRFQFKLSASSR